MLRVFWTDLSRIALQERLKNIGVVIIPTGSTEQHGPHLPVSHDMRACLYIVRKAAEELYPKVLITPPVAIGYSWHHFDFPGTLSLRAETFINVLIDICKSLKMNGVKKIAIINGHGGNEPLISIAARRVRDELGLKIIASSYWYFSKKEEINEVLETKGWVGHACEYETSMGMVIYPEWFKDHEVPKLERFQNPRYILYRPIPSMLDYSPYGVGMNPEGLTGDPSPATPEKGRKLIDLALKGLVEVLKEYMEAKDEPYEPRMKG